MRQRRARNVLLSRRSAGKDLGKVQLSNDALKVEISLLRAKAQDETKRLQAAAEERSAMLCPFLNISY
jgi:hypothetical protein